MVALHVRLTASSCEVPRSLRGAAPKTRLNHTLHPPAPCQSMQGRHGRRPTKIPVLSRGSSEVLAGPLFASPVPCSDRSRSELGKRIVLVDCIVLSEVSDGIRELLAEYLGDFIRPEQSDA